MIDGWGFSCEIALIWMSLLGAVRQQAITWANVDPDLCRHMASLGPNELMFRCCYWWFWSLLSLISLATGMFRVFSFVIDLSYKSHNAPVPYPTMHHFCNRNLYKCAHFCYKMVHCGIFDALWDLSDGSNWHLVTFTCAHFQYHTGCFSRYRNSHYKDKMILAF